MVAMCLVYIACIEVKGIFGGKILFRTFTCIWERKVGREGRDDKKILTYYIDL